MPAYSYTDFPQAAKLGNPTVRSFFTAAIALSATASTVIDFTPATGDQLGVSPGIPMGCGYSLTDATTGAVVDYGVTVSENAPVNFSTPGQWALRLVVPPVAGAPSVIAHAYLSYFPLV